MIKIVKEACIGCGACQASMPEVFTFDEDGLAEANNDAMKPEFLDELNETINSCPTNAIVNE